MKDYSWNIKIADLLNNPWESDKVNFKNKYLKNIKIQEPWISWKVFLQWLNYDEILVSLEDIKFTVEYVCDKCLNKYKQTFNIKKEENIKFVNTEKIKIEEKIYDDTFPINMKNMTINLEELIEIIVKNQEPIVKNCWKCENEKLWDVLKNQEENLSYKIDFSKLLKS